jgi:ribonuclease P protein component
VLRSADFRRIYTQGSRINSPYFAAFCLHGHAPEAESKAGFTTPRALGGAVIRNRIKRRMREAVRRCLGELGSGWEIVFNPRRSVLTATREELEREVKRVIGRCAKP